jgi:hypothetical protein
MLFASFEPPQRLGTAGAEAGDACSLLEYAPAVAARLRALGFDVHHHADRVEAPGDVRIDPAEALAVYARHTKASADDTLGPKLFAATLPCFTYDLSMTTEAYALLARWLLETGQVKTPVDVSRAWTNRLALV